MGDKQSIIKIENLTKKYGDLTAVNKLNLEIREGEVFGLLGPNGAGKTTTILMLLGLTEPNSGKASISGHDCTRTPIAVKRIVGFLPDNVGFYENMTGRENLRYTGRLNGMPEKTIEERIVALTERAGIFYAIDKKVGTYSRGMRQRLGIADVLMKDPKVVILDEPTLGIDPEGVRELMELILALAKEDNRTVMVSSHQLYQVQQICDRVGIFVKGKLIACGRIDELGQQTKGANTWTFGVEALPNNDALNKLIGTIAGVTEIKKDKDQYIIQADRDIRGEITQKIVQGGFTLQMLRLLGGDLDDIYSRYFEKEGAV